MKRAWRQFLRARPIPKSARNTAPGPARTPRRGPTASGSARPSRDRPPPGKAAAGETAALQERITTLQGQLTESQRLLELKNAELARLQQQLHPGSAPAPAAPAAAPAPSNPPEAAPARAQGNASAGRRSAAAGGGSRSAAAAQARSSGRCRARGRGPGRLAGVELVRAVGCTAGTDGGGDSECANSRRAGNRISAARSTGSPTRHLNRPRARQAETQPMRTLQSKQDSSFVVEESGTHPAPRIGGGESAPLRPVPVAVDDALSASGTRGGPGPGRSAGRGGLPHGLWPVRSGRRSGAHRDISRATAPRLAAQAAGSVFRLGQQGPVPATRARTVREP